MSDLAADVGTLVRGLVDEETLTGATVSRPMRSDPARPSRITVTPLTVGTSPRYRFTAHYATRTTDENLESDAAVRRLVDLLETDFRQGLLHAADADWQILSGRDAPPTILRRPPSRPRATLAHDRAKRYLLPEGTPVPFLVELGVMTREGKVRKPRYDKFRQVNRFLELVDDVLPALPRGRLRVVDFGSGSRTSPSHCTIC